MKRVSLLQEKIKKAQEEEAKVSRLQMTTSFNCCCIQLNEIAFINTLEAQNKKIEVLTRHQGHEARLQDIQVIVIRWLSRVILLFYRKKDKGRKKSSKLKKKLHKYSMCPPVDILV